MYKHVPRTSIGQDSYTDLWQPTQLSSYCLTKIDVPIPGFLGFLFPILSFCQDVAKWLSKLSGRDVTSFWANMNRSSYTLFSLFWKPHLQDGSASAVYVTTQKKICQEPHQSVPGLTITSSCVKPPQFVDLSLMTNAIIWNHFVLGSLFLIKQEAPWNIFRQKDRIYVYKTVRLIMQVTGKLRLCLLLKPVRGMDHKGRQDHSSPELLKEATWEKGLLTWFQRRVAGWQAGNKVEKRLKQGTVWSSRKEMKCNDLGTSCWPKRRQ